MKVNLASHLPSQKTIAAFRLFVSTESFDNKYFTTV
uniref:Uncharacterized protein n=1 Tax=Lepeophtheirus salmonis TaxID=72036 RepID=A0A0K2V051_LEPSM